MIAWVFKSLSDLLWQCNMWLKCLFPDIVIHLAELYFIFSYFIFSYFIREEHSAEIVRIYIYIYIFLQSFLFSFPFFHFIAESWRCITLGCWQSVRNILKDERMFSTARLLVLAVFSCTWLKLMDVMNQHLLFSSAFSDIWFYYVHHFVCFLIMNGAINFHFSVVIRSNFSLWMKLGIGGSWCRQAYQFDGLNKFNLKFNLKNVCRSGLRPSPFQSTEITMGKQAIANKWAYETIEIPHGK